MGNTQSVEAPRRPPNKLTKPRTNTSTSNLLAISSAPSKRGSALSLPVANNNRSSTILLVDVLAVGEDGAPQSKKASRPQRRSLFRTKSANAEASPPLDGPKDEPNEDTASNPLDRYSSALSVRVDKIADPRSGVSDG